MTSRSDQKALTELEGLLRAECSALAPPLQAVCSQGLAGGSRTRALLLLRAAGHTDPRALQAAGALEMLHAATLLQDDIFDASVERRGRLAAHLRFGKAQAILASDWLLVRSLELAMGVHPAFFRCLAGAARTMAGTVALELQPSFEDSLEAAEAHITQVAQGKTGVLFAAAFYAAALLRPVGPDAPERWREVGLLAGNAYQLLDDCIDAYAAPELVDKCVGVDLAAGRLTMPHLFAWRHLRDRGTAWRIGKLAGPQLSPEECRQLQGALMSDAVRALVKNHVDKVSAEIAAAAQCAGVPSNAVKAALADLRRKRALCFGELRGADTCQEQFSGQRAGQDQEQSCSQREEERIANPHASLAVHHADFEIKVHLEA